MSVDEPTERSVEACPVCGEHRLAVLKYPHVDVVGVQLYNEIYGFGDKSSDTPPGIGCMACGSEWPDLEAFKEAAGAR